MQIRLKPIKEQVVVVFGASSGIGRQAALDFAKKGASVVVAARSRDGLYSLVEEINQNEEQYKTGGRAFEAVADAADFAQVKAVADAAVEEFGRIDTWVHSAGVFLFSPFENIEPEEFRRVIEVNLLGQVHGAMVALPHLKKQGGALIHITSVEAWRTAPWQSAYGASKHGTKGFLQALRLELQRDEVPVSVTEIQPGPINTPIYDKGRSKLPFLPRPLSPIYQPNVVSDAILYAAENPIRDLIAGGAGFGAVALERLSPALTDFVFRMIGFAGQKSAEPNPPNRADALFEPVEKYNTTRGRFDDESFSFDPYTKLAMNKTAQNALLLTLGAVGGLLLLRAASRKSDQNGEMMK